MLIYLFFIFFYYLTHSSGKVSQSIVHRNRCHASQPIGGVKAKPLSSANEILQTTKIHNHNTIDKNDMIYEK